MKILSFVQLALMCVLLLLCIVLTVGQLLVQGEWMPYMYFDIVLVALAVLGVVLSWKEWREDMNN